MRSRMGAASIKVEAEALVAQVRAREDEHSHPDTDAVDVHEMSIPELQADLNAVWLKDWHHPNTMTQEELHAEVLRMRSRGMGR